MNILHVYLVNIDCYDHPGMLLHCAPARQYMFVAMSVPVSRCACVFVRTKTYKLLIGS